MTDAPKRPIVLRFVVGKGLVKRRRESEDTARVVIEQAAIAFAENRWRSSGTKLAAVIERDVRDELTFLAAQFRRNVIGAPGSQRGLVGTLTTRAKGPDMPRMSLGGTARWAQRGERYLDDKRVFTGGTAWFDNTGMDEGGTLASFFGEPAATAAVFEEIFGGISVEVRRAPAGGTSSGTIKVGSGGQKTQIVMGHIRVRALGSVTDAMMRVSDQPNIALLQQVAKVDQDVAYHLRGGRGRYRPALEPYLDFFLRRSAGYAVTRRLERGMADGRLFRQS